MAMGFRDIIDGLHAQLAAEGVPDARPAYGFVLVTARASPITVTDVAALLGITKQAASKLVDGMVEAGYLVRRTASADARSRPVGITPDGCAFLERAERIYADLEAQWAAVIGRDSVERLRTDLTAVLLARHGGALPPIRPTW